MNGNDIVGGAALLLVMLVICFLSTPVGMVLLGLLIATGVGTTAYESYCAHEPWTASEPNKFGARQILARGQMDKGHFVLTRERGTGGNYVYPYILTLSVFDRRAGLVSSVAKVVRRAEDNGQFTIGTYRGRSVTINSDHWAIKNLRRFGEPNGYDTWQVYPPQAEIPFRVSPVT